MDIQQKSGYYILCRSAFHYAPHVSSICDHIRLEGVWLWGFVSLKWAPSECQRKAGAKLLSLKIFQLLRLA